MLFGTPSQVLFGYRNAKEARMEEVIFYTGLSIAESANL